MNLFSRLKKDNKAVSYDEALQAGTSIGRIATNIWNSQKNPGKAYFFNRRVHHGEVGVLLGLSNLFRKRRPDAAGVLSGLGEALSRGDIADKEEWFKFKKRPVSVDSEMLPKNKQKPKGEGNEKNGEGN
jgi:hypothetical protein